MNWTGGLFCDTLRIKFARTTQPLSLTWSRSRSFMNNPGLVRVLPFFGVAGSVRIVEVKARRRRDTEESIVEEEQRRDRRSWRFPVGAGRFLGTPRGQ